MERAINVLKSIKEAFAGNGDATLDLATDDFDNAIDKAIEALEAQGQPREIVLRLPEAKVEELVKIGVAEAVAEISNTLYDDVAPDAVVETAEAKAIKDMCLGRYKNGCNGCKYRSITREVGCIFANCPDSWEIPGEAED